VIHDATVDRTMGGSDRVSAMPLGALQGLRARGGGAGGVPALQEVLALARGRARIFLEVKTDDGEPHRAIEKKVLGATRAAAVEAAVTFLSFDLLCLRRLRELDDRVSLGLLTSWPFFRAHGRAAVDRLLEEARGLKVERIGLHHELATPALLGDLQGCGLAIDVWTVNETPALRRFALQGVDGLMTDRPDLLQHVLSELPADAPGA